MSRKNTKVTLNLHATELAAIYGLLYTVRLGNRNHYEKAISDLLIDLENFGIENWLDEYYKITGNEPLKLKVEASDEEGLVLNVA